jgi:hypothetical protein
VRKPHLTRGGPVIEIAKRLDELGANVLVILDNGDRFLAVPWRQLSDFLFRRNVAHRTKDFRQIDLDGGSFAKLTVNFNVTAGLLDGIHKLGKGLN